MGLAGRGLAGFEVVHPGSAAFGFARVPVGVEGAEVIAGGVVVDFVELHLGVPGFRFGGLNFDAKEAGGEIEEAAHDLVDGEVRAEGFVVEGVEFLAAFLGPVGGFPGLERTERGSGFFGFIGLEFFGLGVKAIDDFCVEISGEVEGSLSVPGHAALQDVVGEIGVTEEGCFFLAEAEDVPNMSGVVAFAAVADGAGAFPDLLAEGVVFGILHDREHRGEVLGDAPLSFLVLALGVFGGAVFGGVGEAGEAGFVVDEKVPGVGGIENVLAELLGDLGEFAVDFEHALFGIGSEVGTGGLEVIAGFLDEAFLEIGEGGDGVGFSKRFEDAPEVVVERNGGRELGDDGKHCIESFTEFVGVGDGVEVVDAAPRAVEIIGGGFESAESVFEGGVFRSDGLDGFDIGLAGLDGFGDIRDDVVGRQGGPTDLKIFGKKRVRIAHEEDLAEASSKAKFAVCFW